MLYLIEGVFKMNKKCRTCVKYVHGQQLCSKTQRKYCALEAIFVYFIVNLIKKK